MMVDFGTPTILFMKSARRKYSSGSGTNIPENWVPAIQLVSFDEANHALGFLNLRLRLNDYLLEKGGHIATQSVPLKGAKAMQKKLFIKVCKWLKKRIFIVLWSLVVSRILLVELLY